MCSSPRDGRNGQSVEYRRGYITSLKRDSNADKIKSIPQSRLLLSFVLFPLICIRLPNSRLYVLKLFSIDFLQNLYQFSLPMLLLSSNIFKNLHHISSFLFLLPMLLLEQQLRQCLEMDSADFSKQNYKLLKVQTS